MMTLQGRQVYGFTANELHMTERILSSGADVIITSYPHQVRQVMKRWARQCGRKVCLSGAVMELICI